MYKPFKQKKLMLSILIVNLLMMVSCSKNNSDIFYKELNRSSTSTEEITIDFDDNGQTDLRISSNFALYKGILVSTDIRFAPDLSLIDVISIPRDSEYVNDILFYDKDVNIGSESKNWFGSGGNTGNIVQYFSQYTDGTSVGINKIVSYGPINKGEKYFGFKFMSKYNDVSGWRYGWVKYSTTKDKFIILDSMSLT
jgi:hypothetical protein